MLERGAARRGGGARARSIYFASFFARVLVKTPPASEYSRAEDGSRFASQAWGGGAEQPLFYSFLVGGPSSLPSPSPRIDSTVPLLVAPRTQKLVSRVPRFTVLYFNFFRFSIFFFFGQCSNARCCDTSRARCCQLTFYLSLPLPPPRLSLFPRPFTRHGNLTRDSPNEHFFFLLWQTAIYSQIETFYSR